MEKPDKIRDGIFSAAIGRLKGFEFAGPARVLDVGSGDGALIGELRKEVECETYACDVASNLMELEGQRVDIVDLDKAPLPYPDGFFDVVVCTEVLEHVENFRALLRDIHRVLRDGGIAILSTPNILNLKSRVRFLFSGFWNLFNPLPCHNRAAHLLSGHITPVSYFYLCHGMVETGFGDIRLSIDKINKSSLFLLLLLYLPIHLFSRMIFRKVQRRYKAIDETNSYLIKQTNGLKALLGRTIIVSGLKS